MTKETQNQSQQHAGENVEPKLEITLKKLIHKDKPYEVEICLAGYDNEINTGILLIIQRAAAMQGLSTEDLLTTFLTETIISNKSKSVEMVGAFIPKNADDFFEFIKNLI